MSFTVASLLDAKARKYGVSPASATYQADFLDALNYTLDDIDERLGLTTAAVTDTGASIALDQQAYKQVVSMGVDWHMVDNGNWTVKDSDRVMRDYKDKLSYVHMNYMRSLDLSVRFGDLTT